MSRLSESQDIAQATRALVVDAGLARGIVSAAAALTGAAHVLTFTTDDPITVPNQAITIANGTTVTPSENLEFVEEINDQLGALVVDTVALRVAIEALRVGSRFTVSPVVLTVVGETAITYTTNDPSITVNQSITVADGDLTTVAEMHEAMVEINTENGLLIDDVVTLAEQVNIAISRGFNQTAAVAARTSNVAGVAIVWTTDDPLITAGQTTTIADGDTLSIAENNDLIVELEDQLDKLGDDYLALRTTFVAIQDLAIV